MGASRTAVLVAGYRARASRESGALIHDPWAHALAGEEGEGLTRDFDSAQPDMELWIAIRTRYLDDRIAYLTGPACRIRQVVILGAGLDTRAARLAHSGARFFEVDRPETQEDKMRRLATIADYPVDSATYVTCNFEHESASFVERLRSVGFDPGAPSVFVWEGVTPYLPEESVLATLSLIARECHSKTVVLFDFLGKKIVEGQVKDAKDLEARTHVADLGEPLRFGTNDIVPLVHASGMRRLRVCSFDELALDYTGTYDRSRKWRFQYLAETSVAPPETEVQRR
jgi:methyltransferase (TIGR00027 family)